ncbi:MAG: FAD-dependent oxidoreductase, partial [Thermoplasmata archaeon]|nr:FAD-dependent oxidoreductase [Thermoplasmata archaeon]
MHKDDPKQATEKAKDLVRMGVAKARLLLPGAELRIPVGKECLVIGGGIAGMTSALALGDLDFKVILVEKTGALGGILNKLYKVAPSDSHAQEIIQPKIEAIIKHKNIAVYTNTEVTDVKGYVGNYKIKLTTKTSTQDSNVSNPIENNIETHDVSTIIVATGMAEVEPVGQFGYGKFPNVITQLQFEELLKTDMDKLANLKDIAFINCVNSRNTEHGCCNVGCLSAIKNIKNIKEVNNNIYTYLFFRDFNITGSDVQYHYESMDKYAAAFRYPDNEPPEIEMSNDSTKDKLTIQSYDILTGSIVKLDVDLVVLTTGYNGDNSTEQLKGLLKVSTNSDGFFQEAHVKLRPLDFANEGIYICGCARSPKDIRETLEESIGAAMRAAIPMNRSYVETEGIVANIESEECISCGICSDVCAFGATKVVENKSEVIQAICKGCGTCATSCPSEAIRITHYSDSQIMSQVNAALVEHPEDKIVAFACHWCALGAVDNAGISRLEYPPNIRIIR